LKNNRHALVELPQMLADAGLAGQLDAVEPVLSRELARESFIAAFFDGSNFAQRWHAVRDAPRVAIALRLRLLVYAACPALLAPWFALKRFKSRGR
jgi:hypothetical protein